jgi:2,4-diketo-3-deoxy-L-fuconate hydrolase
VYLMRIGAVGAEKPVARIDDETYVDLSDVVTDFDEAFFAGGGLDRVRPLVAERAAAGQVSRFAGERVGAPIARPHQILCAGLNYRDHAAESGMPVPDEPILFTKSPINTGTPPGVGMGLTPQVWLQPGDVMELGITHLGTQRQHVLGPR